jgi:hypothetical protein
MTLHPDVKKLLREITTYCKRNDLDRTRFGLLAVNDGHLVPRMQAGRQPRLSTIDKVRRFIKRNGAKRP